MRKSFLLVVLAMLGVLGEAVSANLVRAERVAPQGASAKPASVSVVRDLLRQPEETIDLAKAKLTIDRMFDHSGTARPEQTLRLIEEWADKVRARVPPGASGQRTMDALVSTLYESGAWNDFRPFSYDYDTPPGSPDLSLSTYLATRKGQCVTMPTLVAALGQKLGLHVTLTTAPYHMMAKYGDDTIGQWVNLEATTGRRYDDGSYIDSMQIPEIGVVKGTYLRPHAPREAVALLVTASLGPVYKTYPADFVLGLTEAVLEANPLDVMAMVIRADAYYMLAKERHLSRFPSVHLMPPAVLGEFNALVQQNRHWLAKAESLGWKARTPEDWSRYLEHLAKRKAEQTGEP